MSKAIAVHKVTGMRRGRKLAPIYVVIPRQRPTIGVRLVLSRRAAKTLVRELGEALK